MRAHLALLVFCLGILTAFSPLAATVGVTVDSSPPTGGDVLLGFDTPINVGTYLWSHGSAMEVGIGQTFRLDRTTVLEAITLKITPESRVASEGIELWIGSYSDPTDVTMNEVVQVELGGMPSSLLDGTTYYVTFNLSDLQLEGSRQYGFLLKFAGGGNVNEARGRIHHLGRNAYPDGVAFTSGGNWEEPLAADLVFFLHGEDDQGDWLWSPAVPDFRFRVRITSPTGATPTVQQEPLCIPETVCASGALPGRSEVFLRVVGPKPNGWMWPTIVKFTTSQVEVWVEQIDTGEERYYLLEAASPGDDTLDGMFDRGGFLP